MTETLTESFCERCGTRYEFHAPTRLNPLRKTRGFIGGLRNYLTSQDALSDAMGDAMRSEEENLAAAQLEAFHESFNFCIDCRQYTCLNCWNDANGRCRSCAPIAGTDDLAERLAASVTTPVTLEPAVVDESAGWVGNEAWPSSDLPSEAAVFTNGRPAEAWPSADGRIPGPEPAPDAAAARAADGFVYEEPAEAAARPADEAWEPVAAEVEPEPVAAEVEPEPMAAELEAEPELVAIEVEPEPVVAESEPEAGAAEVEVEPEPVVAEIEPEAVAAEVEVEPEPVGRPLLRVVAWDDDSAYDIIEPRPEPVAAEVEPEPVVAEVEVEPEPVAAEVEPEPAVGEVEVEPEPVAAEVEPEPVAAAEAEPEPVAAAEAEPELLPGQRAPRIAPIHETILHFPTRSAPAPQPSAEERVAALDDTPEQAARRAQLDMLGLGDPGQGPVPPQRPQPLPYRSRGAAVSQEELARMAAVRGSFWEASAREVAGAPGQVGVQSCGQCGLSLSANARFCRRCGARQAQSA